MTLNIILGISLLVSVSANILAVWYIQKLLQFITNVTSEINEVVYYMKEYEEHLDKVYNMDIYYGDVTLESLLKHTRKVTEDLEAFISTTTGIFDEDGNESQE
jgi:hypothetical protein|tara:strand:+ start:329 stop:637 length:309 start_codon:yes stop_codon:yes gene_type:complete